MGAGWGEDGGERPRSWYVSRDEIELGSPSRRDGVSAAKEAELRTTYCSFIRDVCVRLQLPQITVATAILLCHRFYLRQSHAKNEWQTVATVCIFLASKMEDTPCLLKHVVTAAYETMYQKNPDAAKRIHQKEVLEKQKALILVGETLLLSTIRFDFNIQHPYDPLKLALKNLGIVHKELRQTAMRLINDTLPTTLAVQFKPHYIAAGSLCLAAKFQNVDLSSLCQNGRIWLHEFDVAPELLKVVVQRMTELFKKRDPCSMVPVINPEPNSTMMDKQQTKPTVIPTPIDKHQIKPTPALVNKHQINPTPTPVDRHQIKPVPTPTSMDKLQSKPTPTPIPMDKHKIKVTPTSVLTDRQHLERTPDSALRHTKSSRRSFSYSNTEVSRCVGSSFDNKSTISSTRNEESCYRRTRDEDQYRQTHINQNFDHMLREQSYPRTLKAELQHTEASRCMGSSVEHKSIIRSGWDEGKWYRRTSEADQYHRIHTNHNLDHMLREQSYRRTLKPEFDYFVRSGSKDTNGTEIKNLARQKRRIQEVGGLPAPDTNAWRQVSSVVFETTSYQRKHKVERR